MTLKLTERHARKVLEVVDEGLVKGLGSPHPGSMCVEAAVCYALGLPHDDNPPCVSSVIRALKIVLNDANWSSNAARSAGLRKLAILQLGTDHDFDEREFVSRVTLWAVRNTVADLFDTFEWGKEHATILRGVGDLHAARAAANSAARAAANSAANSAARAATYAAAYAAARAATYAAANSAANSATYAAANSASAAVYTARAAVYTAAGDKVLHAFGEGAAQILIDMKVPGVKWLGIL